jgi:hypothetical protein
MEQETLNFWKQTSHVLKYFRAEEDPKAKLPNNFINGFLEVGIIQLVNIKWMLIMDCRVVTKQASNPDTDEPGNRSMYIAETIPFPSCTPCSMLPLNA